ncbi:MAG: DMT family transporter [Acidimicrobiales bacterium]
MLLAVVASLLAALLYAGASVLQHRAAASVPAEHSLRLGLLARLVANPWWLAGVAADGLAFVMQFIALGHGPLVVVQPLLVSGLLFALPLGAIVSGGHIKASEIRASALVVVGLAVLLAVVNPTSGHSALSATAWAVVAGGVLVPAALLVALARSTARPAMLAAAAASVYGLTAALAKVAAHDVGQGFGRALTSWELYALIPGGLLGMVLCQSAFQAGPLAASLPTLTAVDPVVSILIGVLAFHEQVGHEPARIVAACIGTAVMVGGVFVLGRSPLVALEEAGPIEDAGSSDASADEETGSADIAAQRARSQGAAHHP